MCVCFQWYEVHGFWKAEGNKRAVMFGDPCSDHGLCLMSVLAACQNHPCRMHVSARNLVLQDPASQLHFRYRTFAAGFRCLCPIDPVKGATSNAELLGGCPK